MAQQELRHIPNLLPDYDTFVASLQPSPTSGNEGSSPKVAPFTSSPEFSKLGDAVRSWLLQSIQLVVKAWPPSSSQCPTSEREETEQDFSIYVGTGEE